MLIFFQYCLKYSKMSKKATWCFKVTDGTNCPKCKEKKGC